LSACKAFEDLHFVKGENIVTQGTPACRFHIIYDGTCAVHGQDGTQSELVHGACFGGMELRARGVHAATIEVTSDACTVLVLPRAMFDLMSHQPEVVTAFTCTDGSIATASLEARLLRQQTGQFKTIKSDLGLALYRSVPQDQLEYQGTLGRGSFGLVSLVKDKSTGYLYGLKVMSKGKIIEGNLKSSILNEKNCMELCESEFIVRLCCTYRDSLHIYLLLEACLGGTLFDIYVGSLEMFGSETHAKFYVGCSTLAMDHMHSRHIIYRDLKLENCLLTTGGYLKITDMGLSKVVIGKTFSVCGTPDYFAPETLRQTGHNRGVDWWALGIMTFIMMSGRSPFYDDNVMTIGKNISRGFTKDMFPMSMPDDCSLLIRALCRKQFEQRLPMGSKGVDSLKEHSWFDDFAWPELELLTMPPPFIPEVTEESVIAAAKQKEYEPFPEFPYEDDGTNWDDEFATA